MIDACSFVHHFDMQAASRRETLQPLLHCRKEWDVTAGQGVIAGLLDTHVDQHLPDVVDADVTIRDFVGPDESNPLVAAHGTHAVSTLVGQGSHQIRGIAPQARLFVATVIGSNRVAQPDVVTEALAWLTTCGVRLIALPLGDLVDRQDIATQIERAAAQGIVFFAATGNTYPRPLLFPARHPLTIAVGAADHQGYLLPYCNRFPRLDLVALGYSVAAPIEPGVIREHSGSSVACIVALGAAILALSAEGMPAGMLSRAHMLALLLGHRIVLPA